MLYRKNASVRNGCGKEEGGESFVLVTRDAQYQKIRDDTIPLPKHIYSATNREAQPASTRIRRRHTGVRILLTLILSGTS